MPAPRVAKDSPQWDPNLPRTVPEIEAAIDAALTAGDLSTPRDAGDVERSPNGSRWIKMDPQTVVLLKLQLQLFRAVFGRDPGKRDPVFWDRDRECDGVFPLSITNDQMADDAAAVGIRPEIVYAIRKTGRIVTARNRTLLSEDELNEWTDAVEEYMEMHPGDGGN